ncbi:MAG: response regulator [Calditrichaeota bacterium]|nr:response regulator [Calditrichota bacterium]
MGEKRILVVDDNDLNLELVTDLLEVAGFSVHSATTAEEGIRLAQIAQPDLILMDVGLPGMDGLEAARILKSDARTRGIPLVALTAHAMRGDREKALAAGCDGYITKPIDTRTFVQDVRRFASAHKQGVRV